MGSLWNRSGTIERSNGDLPAAGAKAYFYEGGTTTPLIVFRDRAEASAFAHPLEADALGRWPDIFVPFIDSYDVRVTTSGGEQLTFTLEIPNADALAVPPAPDIGAEQLIQTGMIHAELINTTKIGFVRLNGRTMGNAASGATERADDDTLDLFTYLWGNLSNTVAPVSGGRGATAADDFAGNKTIQLANLQGAVPLGLDDMGATAGSFFTGLTFAVGNATTPGSSIGADGVVLTTTELPAHTHTGTTNAEAAHTHTGTTGVESVTHVHEGATDIQSADHTHDGTTAGQSTGHTHSVSDLFSSGASTAAGGNPPGGTTTSHATGDVSNDHTHNFETGVQSDDHNHDFVTENASVQHTHSFTSGAGSSHTHTFTSGSTGIGGTFNNLPRSVLVTWFIKL